MSWSRVRAIFRKGLREYRRTPSIVLTMTILPLIFLVTPVIEVFAVPAASASELLKREPLYYLLGIPAIVPAALASYSIVGERLQGTLEPLLTTPIRREELLLGKAFAVFTPAIVVSYVVFGVFLAVVELFAPASVAAAVVRGGPVLVQVVFTPLLVGWSTWVGVAISTRASDARTSQQLGMLASLPTIALTTLVSIGTIDPTQGLAVRFAVALVVVDVLGYRAVSRLLDRERLITGTRT